jgi:hypothetical protein
LLLPLALSAGQFHSRRCEKVASFNKVPLLFAYGTLQQNQVQLSTFGRVLPGAPDKLVGFIIAEVRIDSKSVVASSGKEYHPIAKFIGLLKNRIPGTVFEMTENELQQPDQYEVDNYQRIQTTLVSRKNAWMYVETP